MCYRGDIIEQDSSGNTNWPFFFLERIASLPQIRQVVDHLLSVKVNIP